MIASIPARFASVLVTSAESASRDVIAVFVPMMSLVHQAPHRHFKLQYTAANVSPSFLLLPAIPSALSVEPNGEAEAVVADAVAHMNAAVVAVLNEDLDGIVCCLDAALRVFEEHPSYARSERRLLTGLLVAIFATGDFRSAIGHLDVATQRLVARAEALGEIRLH